MGHNDRNKKKQKKKRHADPPEPDLRRSLRRRNVKYVFDLDDYFDEDDLFEDETRREKKLNSLLNLQTAQLRSKPAAPTDQLSPSSSEGGRSSKKRKVVDDDDDFNLEENYSEGNDEEITRKMPVQTAEYSNPRTQPEAFQGIPFPDKKTLELILDKLQKKDIYGVYAEPVDPEELPDYHDVIKHPMDFATVRKKLGNGSYESLEQFEGDVFLICSNAMEYNAPDTVYYKQARSIQELAARKFQKLRLKTESTNKYAKHEEKLRPSYDMKKPTHGASIRMQERFASNISVLNSFTLADDFHNISNTSQSAECERFSNADIVADGNYSFNENILDKGDESLTGKNMMSRIGRKSSMQEENRRESYDISASQNAGSSWSLFSPFDSESKQLIPVGLYSDHSYARSLARFAATLGSEVWEITSKRIEQALPQGFEYGRGWVGEYEPLPTPVLIIENCKVKEPPFFTKVKPVVRTKKHEDTPLPISSWENRGFASLPFYSRSGDTSCSNSCIPGRELSTKANASDMSSFFLSSGIKTVGGGAHASQQQHISQFRTSMDTDQKVLKQGRHGGPPLFNQNVAENIGQRQNLGSIQMEVPKAIEFSARHGIFPMVENTRQTSNGVSTGALHGGKVVGILDGSNVSTTKTLDYYQQGNGQVLTDPGRAPSSNNPMTASTATASSPRIPVGNIGFRPTFGNRDNPNSHISVNSPRDMQPQLSQFRGEFASTGNNSLPHPFISQGPIPSQILNNIRFPSQPLTYPQLAADLSRFQAQPTWRSISQQMQPRRKQESLPPDLNIGFQSSGSPGGPSSGILVDPQQPDLALQL